MASGVDPEEALAAALATMRDLPGLDCPAMFDGNDLMELDLLGLDLMERGTTLKGADFGHMNCSTTGISDLDSSLFQEFLGVDSTASNDSSIFDFCFSAEPNVASVLQRLRKLSESSCSDVCSAKIVSSSPTSSPMWFARLEGISLSPGLPKRNSLNEILPHPHFTVENNSLGAGSFSSPRVKLPAVHERQTDSYNCLEGRDLVVQSSELPEMILATENLTSLHEAGPIPVIDKILYHGVEEEDAHQGSMGRRGVIAGVMHSKNKPIFPLLTEKRSADVLDFLLDIEPTDVEICKDDLDLINVSRISTTDLVSSLHTYCLPRAEVQPNVCVAQKYPVSSAVLPYPCTNEQGYASNDLPVDNKREESKSKMQCEIGDLSSKQVENLEGCLKTTLIEFSTPEAIVQQSMSVPECSSSSQDIIPVLHPDASLKESGFSQIQTQDTPTSGKFNTKGIEERQMQPVPLTVTGDGVSKPVKNAEHYIGPVETVEEENKLPPQVPHLPVLDSINQNPSSSVTSEHPIEKISGSNAPCMVGSNFPCPMVTLENPPTCSHESIATRSASGVPVTTSCEVDNNKKKKRISLHQYRSRMRCSLHLVNANGPAGCLPIGSGEALHTVAGISEGEDSGAQRGSAREDEEAKLKEEEIKAMEDVNRTIRAFFEDIGIEASDLGSLLEMFENAEGKTPRRAVKVKRHSLPLAGGVIPERIWTLAAMSTCLSGRRPAIPVPDVGGEVEIKVECTAVGSCGTAVSPQIPMEELPESPHLGPDTRAGTSSEHTAITRSAASSPMSYNGQVPYHLAGAKDSTLTSSPVVDLQAADSSLLQSLAAGDATHPRSCCVDWTARTHDAQRHKRCMSKVGVDHDYCCVMSGDQVELCNDFIENIIAKVDHNEISSSPARCSSRSSSSSHLSSSSGRQLQRCQDSSVSSECEDEEFPNNYYNKLPGYCTSGKPLTLPWTTGLKSPQAKKRRQHTSSKSEDGWSNGTQYYSRLPDYVRTAKAAGLLYTGSSSSSSNSNSSSSSESDSDNRRSNKRRKGSRPLEYRRRENSERRLSSPSSSPDRRGSVSPPTPCTGFRSNSRSHLGQHRASSPGPRLSQAHSPPPLPSRPYAQHHTMRSHQATSPWYERRPGRTWLERRERNVHDERWRMQQKAIDERRVVYIGKILDGTTTMDLRQRFQVFGEVENCSVHFREYRDNYAFVTYRFTCDAFAAVEKGHSLRLAHEPPFDLCFGGRRQFCKTSYSDLDSSNSVGSRGHLDATDFDTLLRAAQLGRPT
uniref:peroxisome proliferator-activated receptor gamma coactivator-related protein 1-like isoform X2 n=1 Tax=Myxine glutinosa TaxID=7769 RepID=UPI00358FA790